MLWARLNRGGLCGGVSWRRPVTTVTVTVLVVHPNCCELVKFTDGPVARRACYSTAVHHHGT